MERVIVQIVRGDEVLADGVVGYLSQSVSGGGLRSWEGSLEGLLPEQVKKLPVSREVLDFKLEDGRAGKAMIVWGGDAARGYLTFEGTGPLQ